ncbi:MAG: DUF547 domain-containing protein [Leptospirales bacterium]|nr:DUF547 domain-containing protein [Leptospirales bacterium]
MIPGSNPQPAHYAHVIMGAFPFGHASRSAAIIVCLAATSLSLYGAPNDKYGMLTELLRAHVHSGRVEYRALKVDSRLESVVRQFSEAKPELLATRGEQMAFWINAYNVFTLKLIADHYPISSINELHSAPGLVIATVFGRTVWDGYQFSIGGKAYTLNWIEHEILRERYKDFRIHGAINCASRSCPPLRSEAFEPTSLDRQLDDQMRAFLTSSFHNRYDAGTDTLQLSKIFDWFRGDFERAGKLPESIKPYLSEEVRTRIGPGTKIKFIDYDWSLND